MPACLFTCLPALQTAGYRMAITYRSQFLKLMVVAHGEFRQRLLQRALKELEANPVANRLETFLALQRYSQPPEGWNMPTRDLSSQCRA